MAKKILNIIESAYRATIEEQDDTIIWLTHAMKSASADISVVFCGNAVGYGVKEQDASGLSFGAKRQTQPPFIEADIARLLEDGVEIFYVREDLSERGIEPTEVMKGLTPIGRRNLPGLLDRFDQICHW